MLPVWLVERIANREVMAVNIAYPRWREALTWQAPKKWRIHLAGLGDVGGTLLTGLRLLGGEDIAGIGIFDLDQAKIKRWESEVNQIRAAFDPQPYPDVYPISAEEMFDCDLFVFCVSVGVPPGGRGRPGCPSRPVGRQWQNCQQLCRPARQAGFAGIFAVVSDPVDLLCRMAYDAGSRDENGQLDFQGLAPEQIRGYGLGVMNARAVYYARQEENLVPLCEEGRAYGPHGQGAGDRRQHLSLSR